MFRTFSTYSYNQCLSKMKSFIQKKKKKKNKILSGSPFLVMLNFCSRNYINLILLFICCYRRFGLNFLLAHLCWFLSPFFRKDSSDIFVFFFRKVWKANSIKLNNSQNENEMFSFSYPFFSLSLSLLFYNLIIIKYGETLEILWNKKRKK